MYWHLYVDSTATTFSIEEIKSLIKNHNYTI